MERTVLCYIKKENQYLMLHRNKKKKDMNKDKWVGIGGHIEANETIEEALLREVKEETGLTLVSYKNRGYIKFVNDDYEEEMFLFSSNEFEGEIIDCLEGELSWIDESEIFSLNLWEGDKYFLKPLINNEKYFNLELIYSKNKLIKCIKKRNIFK